MVYFPFKNSNYQIASGNTFWNVLFNLGNYGEFLTYRILEKSGETKLLCNLYIPKKNGKTAEIDVLSINKKGIFVHESKNYSGWIFGDEKNKNWTQCLKGGKKYKFYNPILQNKGHILAIESFLENKYSNCFLSYIVFSNRCELKKINYTSKHVRVINRYHLKRTLKKDNNSLPDVLSPDDIQSIYEKLKVHTLVTQSIKEKHLLG